MTTTSILKFPTSEFPTIICTNIKIKPETTPYKWSIINKNPSVIVSGALDTARTVAIGGEKGVIGNIPFIIGTDEKFWVYNIFVSGEMYVGVALETQDFTTVDGTIVNKLLKVTEGDRIRFKLTLSNTLIIRHETGTGLQLGTFMFDLTINMGQTIYYWASTTNNNTMSVKVLNDICIGVDVSPDGTLNFTSNINNGSATITTGKLNVDDLMLDGNTISTSTPNTDINIIPDGTGEVLLKSDPVSVLGAATKQYVDFVVGGNSDNKIINNNNLGITVEDNLDNAFFDVGVSYSVKNVTSAVAMYNLELRDYMVLISNSVITMVNLPPVTLRPGKKYIIVRNYPVQVGEIWSNSVLKIIPDGVDCIEFNNSIGVPPYSDIKLISDGIKNWRIL